MKKHNRDSGACDWVQANLEVYLEQELAAEAQDRLVAHVRSCARCRKELELAQELLAALHGLPEKTCPPGIRSAVLARARGNRLFGFEISTHESIFDRLATFWRPAVALSAFAAILVIAALFSFNEQKTAAHRPEEVARAEVELKWTFAYIGRVTRKSTQTVVNEVIPADVLQPLQQAVGAALGTTRQK